MENYENTGNEISLLDIWNRIWKNKFLVIIITFVILVLGTVVLFVFNRSNTSIVNSFDYQFSNKSQGRYPDGSFYDYNDIVTDEFLEEVISKNQKFKDVDIEKLDIEINRIEEMREVGNNVMTRVYLRLEVNNRQFNSNDDAVEFIKAIHKNFLDRVREKNEAQKIVNLQGDVLEGLTKNFKRLTYSEIFTLIGNQNALISNDMEGFISTYGNALQGSQSIEQMKSDYNLWYNTNVNLSRLELAVIENDYIRNVAETVRLAQLRLNQVNRSINDNEQVIAELEALINTLPMPNEVNELDVFYREIETRTINNVSLRIEKADLENVVANTVENTDPDFENFITSVVDNQRQVTDEYNEFKLNYLNSITIYQRFDGFEEYEVVKPFNMILMVVVLGMVGGIIGVSAALIKEAATKKEEQLEA